MDSPVTPADFADLCERLRAIGATEVVAGELRASFARPSAPAQEVPSNPQRPKRRQPPPDADKLEAARRERMLRGVGA